MIEGILLFKAALAAVWRMFPSGKQVFRKFPRASHVILVRDAGTEWWLLWEKEWLIPRGLWEMLKQMVRMASDGAPDGMDVELFLRSGARDPV